jgi:hypothetical protein
MECRDEIVVSECAREGVTKKKRVILLSLATRKMISDVSCYCLRRSRNVLTHEAEV